MLWAKCNVMLYNLRQNIRSFLPITEFYENLSSSSFINLTGVAVSDFSHELNILFYKSKGDNLYD